jgi:hypothetical protein
MVDTLTLQQQTHLILTQYHRWFQVYEVPFTETRIANQKDILSDGVEISSQAGTSKGKADLETRLNAFAGWKNAHHVQNTEVKSLPDGRFTLESDIVYQNIRPDQTKSSYRLHYSTRLIWRENNLPLFEKIDLQPTGVERDFEFKDAYPKNRANSLIHYWLYLLETGCNEFSSFREILAANYFIQLSDESLITNREDLMGWVKSSVTNTNIGSHTFENLKVVSGDNNTLYVSMDLHWLAIGIDGRRLIETTHQEWQLENKLDERFARLKTMKITPVTEHS